jgi:hypothetical protein
MVLKGVQEIASIRPVVGYSPEEENRPSEKLHSTLNVEKNSRASSSSRFSVVVSYPQGAHPQGMLVNRQFSAGQRPTFPRK